MYYNNEFDRCNECRAYGYKGYLDDDGEWVDCFICPFDQLEYDYEDD